MMGLSLLGGQKNEKAQFHYLPFVLLVLIIFSLSKLLIPKTIGELFEWKASQGGYLQNQLKNVDFPLPLKMMKVAARREIRDASGCIIVISPTSSDFMAPVADLRGLASTRGTGWASWGHPQAR